ncbi:MAG TPA: MMPL family transporter [Rhodothermales bacterium]|nr:MMPL family transporter [Rhodothermales bacterium]
MVTDPFARLGVAMARMRWIVLAIWAVILVVTGGFLAPNASTALRAGGYFLPGSESARADEILGAEFNAGTISNLLIIFQSDDLTFDSPQFATEAQGALDEVAAVDGIKSVASVYNTNNPSLVSADGRTALALVTVEGSEAEVQDKTSEVREPLESLSLNHWVTGTGAISHDVEITSEHDLRKAEFFTIPIVMVLLLLVFRTVISAAVPLILGGSAVVTALSILYLVGTQTDMSIFALNVASMIGLGLGIDFSLIIVSRFREELRLGRSTEDAIAITMATAGRSVTYSGIIVMLGMLVLTLLFGLMLVRSISFGVLLVAMTALLSAMTLLPALLAVLGHRIEWLRVLPAPKPARQGEQGFWYTLSHAIMRRPWVWLGASLLLLAVLSLPVLDLKMYGTTSRVVPSTVESAEGVIVLSESFGANAVSPIQVVIHTDQPNGVWRPEFLSSLRELVERIDADPRVAQTLSIATLVGEMPPEQFEQLQPDEFMADPGRAFAASQFVNVFGENDTAVITIFSQHDQFATEHEEFVYDLRNDIIPGIRQLIVYDVLVGGNSAIYRDFEDFLYARFPYLILAVLALTFVILMMFFQSVFLPLKAIFMNATSILATYGLLILVFQEGWGAGVLGFEEIGRLNVFTPAVLFAILFCLSTDYEVFMLSRVKELYHETGHNEEAVALGLERTAVVITAAGLILIGTFGSFGIADVITIKEIGIGLAIGVFIDATIVRVVMVPATMRLMGDLNWWMPAWLKKIVPELSEGPAPEPARPALGPSAPAYAAGGAVALDPATPPQPWQAPVQVGRTAPPRLRIGELRSVGGSVGVDTVVLPTSYPFRIGRDASSELQLFDRRISRRHAQIERVGDVYRISDLNSSNGIYINGNRINVSATLNDHDQIEIGNMGTVRFVFTSRWA